MFNISGRTWDAIVALLLCHLPNLETFRVETYSDDRQHARDGIRGFEFILRVLKSSKVDRRQIMLPKLRNVNLKFTNSLHRKRLQQTLLSDLPSLKTFHYEVFRNMDQHRPSSRRSREVGLSLRHVRKMLLTDSEYSLEELSIVVRYVSAQAGHAPLGSLSSLTKLRYIRASAHVLIGKPTLASNSYLRTPWEVAQEGFYSPLQEENFYDSLPNSIEALILIDCPNAMYGCIKRLLQSSHSLQRLKRIELGYTYPWPHQEDWRLGKMSEWLSGVNFDWCGMFPGENWATKKELEDLALQRGIVLVQKMDECYMN